MVSLKFGERILMCRGWEMGPMYVEYHNIGGSNFIVVYGATCVPYVCKIFKGGYSITTNCIIVCALDIHVLYCFYEQGLKSKSSPIPSTIFLVNKNITLIAFYDGGSIGFIRNE